MPFENNIPFFCIMISMLTGVLSCILKGKSAEKASLASLSLIIILTGILLYYFINGGESFTYMMGHYPAPWGNELRAGLFEALMAFAFPLVMLMSLMAGRQSIFREIPKEKQGIFYLMMNLLMSSLLVLIYTNDIFTAYVFVEINTIAACCIVVAKDTGETVIATIQYLIMSLLGSGMFLIAISLLYDLTGHLLMPNMLESIKLLADSGEYAMPLSVIIILISVGLAIKSALYPFHSWLADAHGSATSASSAVLSGIVLKGYIILLLKIFYRVIGLEVVHRLQVADVLFLFGLLGMIMGSINAMREKNIKRMIAYSSVAQMGYIYMGIGLSTTIGIIAAAFHILAHAFTKPMIFCAADGLMDVSGQSKKIIDLKGAGYRNILAGVAFTIGTFSMIGIPFFSGFVSKLYFATASLHNAERMIPTLIVLALSTILNAMYYFPVLIVIYTYQHDSNRQIKISSPKLYTFIMTCFIAINLYMGIYYRSIIRVLEKGLSTF